MPPAKPLPVVKAAWWSFEGTLPLSVEAVADINAARRRVIELSVLGLWSLRDNEALMRALVRADPFQRPTEVLSDYLASRSPERSNLIVDNTERTQ